MEIETELVKVNHLLPLVRDIMERREFSECWHTDGIDIGDCGDWDYCADTDCSLYQLKKIVGLAT